MKVISTYTKPEEANLAASFLRGNGVFCSVRDENTVNQDWLYSNAIGGVKLEVADEDFEKAKEILNLPAEKGIILQCPHCGSEKTKMREMNPLSAIFMIVFYAFIPIKALTVDCYDCKNTFKYKRGSAEPVAGGDQTR
jgi:hypothetical protein